eukprot:CAMPEP_0116031954 /NCGR_PEP_ID=MMETSP0321-20121206/17872_1 /TAXON_ID=163516 /ORGANISM="Leptocylindrus danicus var. danicus, Strain B650" /LENGTH=113 /DNA_ID=CAMNT_0003507279 /DNA_START=848 /DNA_END=1189 /DNA_ORIENTATION=+
MIDSSPEVIDLTQDEVTPTPNPSIPEPASLPPLPLSLPTASSITALVPLRKRTDEYMEAPTTTSKRPAKPPPIHFPKTINSKSTRSKKMNDFFDKMPKAKLTKSAQNSADLAN